LNKHAKSNQARRKGLPPVPEFGKKHDNPDNMMMIEEEPQRRSSFDEKVTPQAKNEKMILESPTNSGEKGDHKKELPHPESIPSSGAKKLDLAKLAPPKFSDLNLARISNLYASKQQQQQQNKDQQQPSQQSVKTDEAKAAVESMPVQLQRIKEEYDPARPNDFELVMAERRRKQIEEERNQ
jgi:hypothetical protein